MTGRVNTAFWHGRRARRVLLDRRPEAPEPPVVRGQGSGVRRRLPCIREQAFGNGATGLSACFSCFWPPCGRDDGVRTGLLGGQDGAEFVRQGRGALEGTLGGHGVSTARAGLGGVDETAGPAPGAFKRQGSGRAPSTSGPSGFLGAMGYLWHQGPVLL